MVLPPFSKQKGLLRFIMAGIFIFFNVYLKYVFEDIGGEVNVHRAWHFEAALYISSLG